MKQTAVEWLEEQMKTWGDLPRWMRDDIVEKAKEMEKEQMILIYKAAFQDWFNGELFDFEQYYNETYKNKEK